MDNKKYVEVTLVYFAAITFGLSQPLFNVTTLFRREFDMGLFEVILIVVFFQYVLTGLFVGLRCLLQRWANVVDSLIFMGCFVSLFRQVQQNYLVTFGLSNVEKYGLIAFILLAALVAAVFFRKWVFKIGFPAGIVSPIFGFYFIYAISQHVLPLSFPAALPAASKDAGPPIYLIVLDELSLPLLLNDAGEIDPGRYPNLHAFSKDSLWFRQSASHHPFSEDAFVSFLSGRYVIPEMDGVFVENVEAIPRKSLPRELAARGYAVHMYSDYFGCGSQEFDCRKYHSRASPFFLYRVFVKFFHTFGPDFLFYRWMPFLQGALFDEEHEAGMDYAAKGDNGNLYILHRLMSHAPYLYDRNGEYLYSPHLSLIPGVDFERTVENYREQVMYVDRQLGQFMTALKKSGLYDTAVIAVTGDHGNCWTEKCPGRIQARKIKVVEEELSRVPTMIRAPGLAPRVDDGDFQLVDVFPSLMAAAGFPLDYADSLNGRSGLVSTTPTRLRPFYQVPDGKPVDVGLPARAVDLSKAP